eukprot:5299-Eustigmatos_ZCMA.PRE.1
MQTDPIPHDGHAEGRPGLCLRQRLMRMRRGEGVARVVEVCIAGALHVGVRRWNALGDEGEEVD